MSTPQVTHLKKAVSDEKIEQIMSIMKTIEKKKGGLSGGNDSSYRKVDVKPFDANDERLEFFSNIVGSFAQTVNNKYYNFNIRGFAEPLQFLSYKKGGKYDAHMDINWQDLNSENPNRKLTVITQLSDTNDYEGGDIKLEVDKIDDFVIPRGKGDMICFPAFLMHRVYPLKSGTRHSVVSWLSGDAWI